MKFLMRLLGHAPCVLCGKTKAVWWERSSVDRHFLSSTEHGEKRLRIKAVIDSSGLCGDCFSPRADKAIAAMKEAFAGIFPEYENACGLSWGAQGHVKKEGDKP